MQDEAGNSYPLNSSLDINEGHFLKEIIQKHKFKKTIEIGCAYGISSLFICSALEEHTDARHTIIDPYQRSEWKSIGITNLTRANINFFTLIEQPSEIALPFLLSENQQYQLGFIDGWHTFDHTLIDFFYLSRLIAVGGVIIIDDVEMPAINKMLRYVINYPAYRYLGNVNITTSFKRKLFENIIQHPIRFMSKILPEKARHEISSGKLIKSDHSLNLRTSMVALQKIKQDERSWNWFKNF